MTKASKIRSIMLVTALTCAAGIAVAQPPAPQTTQPPATAPATPTASTGMDSKTRGGAVSSATVNSSGAVLSDEKPMIAPKGVLVDQVVGVVNDDLILESDVEEEKRFAAFEPMSTGFASFSRDKAITRLVDRTLILQQAKLQPDLAVSDADVNVQLLQLRKDLPACAKGVCDTDAGWARFVQAQGFTVPELTERWRQRMEILKFIEERFRAGIRITPEEIKTYYDKTLLPEYTKRKATAPALDSISERIQEVLLQQRVSSLLGDWLTQLKAEGSVRMMRPDEVAP